MGSIFRTAEDFESNTFFNALVDNADTTRDFLTKEALFIDEAGTPLTTSHLNGNWETLIGGTAPTVDTSYLTFLLTEDHINDEEFSGENYEAKGSALYFLTYQDGNDYFVKNLDITVIDPESDDDQDKWDELRAELLSDAGYDYEWGGEEDDEENPKPNPIKLSEGDFIDKAYIADDRNYFIPGSMSDKSDNESSPAIPFLIGSPLRPVRQANYDGSVNWENLPDIPRQIFPYFKRHPGDRRATIRVITNDGICWFSSTNFIVQKISKADSETIAPLPTFDGTTGIFLNPKPRTFAISGGLISADDYQWARSWEYNWSRYLKGSVTHQSSARIFFLYGGWLLGGHLLNYSLSEAAASPHYCGIEVSIYVTDYTPLPNNMAEDWEESTGENSGSYYRQSGKTLDEVMGR